MFGLDFFFASALLALPLAGLPILLHMLFRRKSPIVPFPTLRFVKASIQQTAARRKIQRWVLLACRILLLLLLIWSISQPYIRASSPFAATRSAVAAIVVDTSYSMLLREEQRPLLDMADEIVTGLLREQLKDGRVAVFTSRPGEKPEQPELAAQVMSQWTALKPQAASAPLSTRIGSAVGFLSRQQADQKWLVIVSDLQSREFPAALPELEGVRVILFDLHPERARSAGVVAVRVEPEQPIPGIGCQAAVEVSGHAGAARALDLRITKLDGTPLKQAGPLMASFDASGRSRLRVALPQGLPTERHLLITANLQGDDALPWDNARSQLVELPPRQVVAFFDPAGASPAANFIRLALDPWEGKVAAWPIELKRVSQLDGRENVAVLPLTEWPEEALANRLRSFALDGKTVLLLLQPGLEQSWAGLTVGRKNALLALLPAEVLPMLPGGGTPGSGLYRPSVPARVDRVLEGLTDPAFRLDQLAVRRFVPFGAPSDPAVSTILHLAAASGETGSFGLLYRRSLGTGTVYTVASVPESRYMNPPTHPLFLPLLVSMSLRPPEQRDAQNVEIGQPLVLAGWRHAGHMELDVQGPGNLRVRVRPTFDAGQRRFVFAQTDSPGLYYWKTPRDRQTVAIGNVQLPAGESDLIYKPAEAVVPGGANTVVARSMGELQSELSRFAEPQRRWTTPLALMLILICFEALLASVSELWKPVSLKRLLPRAWTLTPDP